jgi:hypothetical protein
MGREPAFKLVRAEEVNCITTTGEFVVKPDTLNTPASKFKAPICDWIILEVEGQVDVGANGADERDVYHLINRIYLKDDTGDIIPNFTGDDWRIAEYMERGNRKGQAVTPFTASTNNQTFIAYIHIPLRPTKTRSRNDFGINLRNFAKGKGEFRLSTDTTAVTDRIVTVDSLSITPWFRVFDDRAPELKSRLVYRKQSITQTENWYPVNGALRWSVMYNGFTAMITGAYAAQNISSDTLGYSAVPSGLLQEMALMEHNPRTDVTPRSSGSMTAIAVPTQDPLLKGVIIPLFAPREDEKLTMLPQVETLHVLTSGSVAAGNVLLSSVVSNRNPEAGAAVLGIADPSQARTVTGAKGVVVSADGKRRPLAQWDKGLATRLPVKLR